ncbi:MAG: hypothetical protein KC476_06985 [Cyanobacteria bacterium HKST-UBA06]|nr:hypothetical protein [Cyanobacteria bacterium HKST-UBA06]MCA9841454.1 hypothetical protein [Cyanobacteria bacterium HKST-UBA03]
MKKWIGVSLLVAGTAMVIMGNMPSSHAASDNQTHLLPTAGTPIVAIDHCGTGKKGGEKK